MHRARSERPSSPRSRSVVVFVVVAAATTMIVQPAPAAVPALTLGLAAGDAASGRLDPASPPRNAGGFGLALDPGLLSTASAVDGHAAPATGDDVPLPPAAAATVPSLAAFPRRVWQDLGALVRRPLELDSNDWGRFAIGAGLVGAVAAFDTRIRDTVQAHASPSSRTIADRIRPIGTWGGVAAMGVLFGVGKLSGNAELASTGADAVEASVLSGIVVAPLLKELAGRSRPTAGGERGAFEPVSRGQSFPSGEATEAFTLAAVVSNHTSSPVWRGLAWGLAGLVGWERLRLNAHWASDVVAGALIGGSIGTWVSRRGALEQSGGRTVAVQPVVGPGVVGLSASLSW